MQWWNDFVDWFNSDAGWAVVSTAVIPFVAIVVAGVVAALIGRTATRRVIVLTERERRIATVTALISAARRAAKWNTLTVPEQQHAEHLVHEADTRIRLLPLPGTAMVADWSAHQIDEMKRNSVNFSFQAEQSLIEFRDKLVEWQARPSRAKKLFKTDLDTWAYESGLADQDLVNQQKEWAKERVDVATGTIDVPQTSAQPVVEQRPANPAAPAAPFGAPAVAEPGAEPSPREPFTGAAFPATEQPPAVNPNTGQLPSYTESSSPFARPSAPPPASSAALPQSIDWAADSTDSGPLDVPAPNPMSADSVRRRITPENPDY